jgi:hypothetical protein
LRKISRAFSLEIALLFGSEATENPMRDLSHLLVKNKEWAASIVGSNADFFGCSCRKRRAHVSRIFRLTPAYRHVSVLTHVVKTALSLG